MGTGEERLGSANISPKAIFWATLFSILSFGIITVTGVVVALIAWLFLRQTSASMPQSWYLFAIWTALVCALIVSGFLTAKKSGGRYLLHSSFAAVPFIFSSLVIDLMSYRTDPSPFALLSGLSIFSLGSIFCSLIGGFLCGHRNRWQRKADQAMRLQ